MKDDMDNSVTRHYGLLRRWSQRKLESRSEARDTEPCDTESRDTKARNAKPRYKEQRQSGGSVGNSEFTDQNEADQRFVSVPVAKLPTGETLNDNQENQQVQLPDVESLTADSDMAAFFTEQVSDALRKTALRKIFRLGKFNICDGLDDYAEDYTNFEPLGNIITADLRLRLERERIKALAELGDVQGDSSESLAVDQNAGLAVAVNDPVSLESNANAVLEKDKEIDAVAKHNSSSSDSKTKTALARGADPALTDQAGQSGLEDET